MDTIIPPDQPLKQCSKCKQHKPATLEYFSKNKQELHRVCKTCRSAYMKQRRIDKGDEMRAYERQRIAQNREHIRAVSRQWHETNREHFRQYSRDYYATHKEVLRKHGQDKYQRYKDQTQEKHRQYKEDHKELVSEQGKLYYVTHKEEAYARSRQRRARKRDVGGVYTSADIQKQFKAQKGKCYYCHKKLETSYEVDHVIPLSREGSSNDPWNLVIACRHCNRSKNNKLPHEWPQGGRLM